MPDASHLLPDESMHEEKTTRRTIQSIQMKPLKHLPSLIVIGCVFCLSADAQLQAPVEVNGFAKLTSYEEVQSFLHRVENGRSITIRHIARTKNGRNVSLVHITRTPPFGSNGKKLRVLLFAQQHGDEPSGKEAMTMLIARASSGMLDSILQAIDLLIVPQMNPDGAELQQRRTAEGVDLNRNHVLLTSPETKALHDVFWHWLPEVTMDIHEYGSFSTEWKEAGFIKTGDVQVGMLTNVNTPRSIRRVQHEIMFPFIQEQMQQRGYSFHEYIVGSPQSYLRHSTTEINDGRQSFGILGTVSFIQEGRKWRTLVEQLERRAKSQLASVEALLRICAAHAEDIRRIVEHERHALSVPTIRTVALRMDHLSSTNELVIPVHMVQTTKDTLWRVHPYRGEVHLLHAVTLPTSYIIHPSDTAVVQLLLRHHVTIDTIKRKMSMRIGFYHVDSLGTSVIEGDTLPMLWVRRKTTPVHVRPGWFVVSTSQIHSHLLAILLEPESHWGLVKYDEFADLRRRKEYPIGRVE